MCHFTAIDVLADRARSGISLRLSLRVAMEYVAIKTSGMRLSIHDRYLGGKSKLRNIFVLWNACKSRKCGSCDLGETFAVRRSFPVQSLSGHLEALKTFAYTDRTHGLSNILQSLLLLMQCECHMAFQRPFVALERLAIFGQLRTKSTRDAKARKSSTSSACGKRYQEFHGENQGFEVVVKCSNSGIESTSRVLAFCGKSVQKTGFVLGSSS